MGWLWELLNFLFVNTLRERAGKNKKKFHFIWVWYISISLNFVQRRFVRFQFKRHQNFISVYRAKTFWIRIPKGWRIFAWNLPKTLTAILRVGWQSLRRPVKQKKIFVLLELKDTESNLSIILSSSIHSSSNSII